MDHSHNERCISFQQRLIEEELSKIDRYLENQSLGVDKEKYLEICEITNVEPDPEKIPIDYTDLLSDTTIAMEITNLLPEKWEYIGGNYEGKDLSLLPMFLDLYDITNRLDITILIARINNKGIELVNKRKKKHVATGNNHKTAGRK